MCYFYITKELRELKGGKLRMCRMKKAVLFFAGCAALLLTGSSFAYWSGELEHTNQLQADEMQAKIIEEFVQGSNPKGFVKKEVSFKNNSTSAAFLRVCYAENWTKESGTDCFLLNNQMNGADVAVKEWKNGFGTSDSYLWKDGGDGWFYYKKVLKPGEETEKILESVAFPEYSGAYEEYADADYQLYFRMELLQVSDSAFTLNSAQVNEKASEQIFGKTAVIQSDGIAVWWQ